MPEGTTIETSGTAPPDRSSRSPSGSPEPSRQSSPAQSNHSTTPPTNPIQTLINTLSGASLPGGAGPSSSTPLTQLFSNLPADQQQLVNLLASHMASERVATLAAAGALGSAPSATQAPVTTAVPAAPTLRIFKESDETALTTIERPISIPEEIGTLFQEGMYLPIHLFTRANLRFIIENRSTMMKKHRIGNGNTSLLDFGHQSLGKETDLNLVLWMEAWANYLLFLETRAEPAVRARWCHHHEALCAKEERDQAFPAVLTFNMAERRAYNEQQFTHEDTRWNLRFLAEMAKYRDYEFNRRMQEFSRWEAGNHPRERVTSASSSTSRFAPYGRERPQPFLSGKPRSSAAGSCLICGRPGHDARDYNQKTTAGHRPVVARFDKNLPHVLVGTKEDKLQFCVGFNVRGPDKCRPGTHGTNVKHACSICGDHSHHAGVCSVSA